MINNYQIKYFHSTLTALDLVVFHWAAGFFYVQNFRVFVIAFSLIALYQPIGKDSKSELARTEVNKYFKQVRVKKVGAMFTTTTPDLQGLMKIGKSNS